MSRSWKRVGVVKDRNRGEKAVANRRVRRTGGAFSGGAYRKLYKSLNICDYVWAWDNYRVTRDLKGVDWEEKKDYMSK